MSFAFLKRFLQRLIAGGGTAPAATAGDQTQIAADAKASAEWISRALISSGYRADFTVDSLKEVDRFFDEHAPGGAAKSGGLLSEQLGNRLFAIGAYVGEVIRRTAGGTWRGDDRDPKAEVNISVHLNSGVVFWPVQRAMKRYKNGAEDSFAVYADGILRA